LTVWFSKSADALFPAIPEAARLGHGGRGGV